MNTFKIWVPGPIPDPIAYNAGFKRSLKAGEHSVPNNADFRRLLLKGTVEPLDALAASICGRKIFSKPSAAQPSSNSKDSK